MEDQNLIQKQETEHLEETIRIAERELQDTLQTIADLEVDMEEEKKEARENITYGIQDMSNPDDFEAFVELSQSMSHVDKMISDYDEYKNRAKMLQTLVKKPYFARVDFEFSEGDSEAIYIGRRSLSDKKTKEILIYDWRTPIAGIFYRFMPGPAYYDAPCGRIDGQLLLKRQYEIKDGRLEYFFDSDHAINDEILRQILSQNTSPKMKAIVETIQSDQDVVIRDMENDLLMVQGVAGSGKTSIALHRAAYLMYQGASASLRSDNIIILSPNSTFEDYIGGVLPELGEDNITSIIFENLLTKLIPDRTIQTYNSFLEQCMTDDEAGELAKTGMRFKTGEHFLELLRFYMDNIPDYGIAYRDIYYKGKCIITKKQLKEQLKKRPYSPLSTRLKQLQEYVLELAFGTGNRRGFGNDVWEMTLQLQEFLSLDPIQLYKNFFASEAYYEEMLAEVDSPELLDSILKNTMDSLDYGTLPYEDAIAIAYLTVKLREKGIFRQIKQVVIDEAQDYYPLQFEILGLMFPNAKFTVLGDINQTLAKQENMKFYSQVRNHLHREKSSLVTLNKSFRCTNEILQYSLHYLNSNPEIESFNRLGEAPKFTSLPGARELAEHILQEIAVCKEKGYESICLLCKSADHVKRLSATLQMYASDVTLLPKSILDYTGEDLTGIMLMPIYLSKGLEFDAVILCDADSTTYKTIEDSKLLYVACTRALHRLSLCCEGEGSKL